MLVFTHVKMKGDANVPQKKNYSVISTFKTPIINYCILKRHHELSSQVKFTTKSYAVIEQHGQAQDYRPMLFYCRLIQHTPHWLHIYYKQYEKQATSIIHTLHSILILTTFFALSPEFVPVSLFDSNPLALLACSIDGSDQSWFLFGSPMRESRILRYINFRYYFN